MSYILIHLIIFNIFIGILSLHCLLYFCVLDLFWIIPYKEKDLLVLIVIVVAVFISDTGESCHCLSVCRTNLGLWQCKYTKYSRKREMEKTRLAQIGLELEQGIKLNQLLRQIHIPASEHSY